MKRNRFSLKVWICICLIFGFTSLAQAYTLTLEPTSDGSTTKTAFFKDTGESIYLNIVVDNASAIAGCAFTLTYPAYALTAPEITSDGLPVNTNEITSLFGFTFTQNSTTYQTNRQYATVDGSTGKIYFSGAAINTTTGGAKYTSGSMVLFTVKFTPIATAAVMGYTFTLTPTTLTNTQAGYSAGGEAVPVLVGAVAKTSANWNTLSAAYPVLLQTMSAATASFYLSFTMPSAYETLVQQIFIGYYQRPADPAGLLYWADQLYQTGGSLTAIIDAFANSDEAQALYGTINSSTIATVVNSIYRAFFNRDADTAGRDWYVAEFNKGTFTAGTIVLNVLYGAQNEDLQSINNKVTAAKMFTRTLDPELDGVDFQATYAGNADAIKGREFLTTVTDNASTIPTQSAVTAYIKTYIADTGDPIKSVTTTAAATSRSVKYTIALAPAASASLGLNRSTPYPRSQVVAAPNWTVAVTDAVRGVAAWRTILAANPSAEAAPAGMEYMLVKINAKSTYTDAAGHSISRSDFRLTGDRLISYPHAAVTPPEPSLGALLQAGGEAEGWVTFAVGIGEGNIILIFDELSNTSENDVRFIALDDGASISVDAAALAAVSPTRAGTEKTGPAALLQKMINDDWEMTVLEVVRGEAALQMVYHTDAANKALADGREYVAVRVHVKYINTEDVSMPTNYLLFRTIGSLEVLYEHPSVVDPAPALDAVLFPGGEAEGWVVTEVAKGETGITLVIDALNDYSGTGTRYASLVQ